MESNRGDPSAGSDGLIPTWLTSLLTVALICGAGVLAGLILCVFSLDVGRLTGIMNTATASEAHKAKKVLRVLENPHWLLITLLLWDDVALELLPLLLHYLLDNPVVAIVSSVLITLFCCEIIPQAVFIRNAFSVAAFFATFLYGLMLISSPIAWPLGKLLDAIVGDKEAVFFKRRELRELIRYQEELLEQRRRSGAPSEVMDEEDDTEEDITKEELTIMLNVLSLSESSAKDMLPCPIEEMYRLHIDAPVTAEVIDTVFQNGYNFVLVYENAADDTAVTSLFLTKTLALLVYVQEEVRVHDLPLLPLSRFKGSTVGSELFSALQDLSPSVAIVTDDDDENKVLGVMTLRAVTEQVHDTTFKAEMDPGNQSPMQLIMRSWQHYKNASATHAVHMTNKRNSLEGSFSGVPAALASGDCALRRVSSAGRMRSAGATSIGSADV